MLMTLPETADALGVSRRTLYRAGSEQAFGQSLEDAGLLPPRAVESPRPMFRWEDVAACIARRQDPAVAGRLRATARRVR